MYRYCIKDSRNKINNMISPPPFLPPPLLPIPGPQQCRGRPPGSPGVEHAPAGFQTSASSSGCTAASPTDHPTCTVLI